MPIQITIIIVATVLALFSWFALHRYVARVVEKRVQQILTVRRELEEGWSVEEHKRQWENALTLRVLQQEVQSHRQLMLTLSAPVDRPYSAELKIIDWVLEHFQTLSWCYGVRDKDLEFASHLLTRWKDDYQVFTCGQREEQRAIEEVLAVLSMDEDMRTSTNPLSQRCLGMIHLVEVLLDDEVVPSVVLARYLLAVVSQVSRLRSPSASEGQARHQHFTPRAGEE